MGKPYSVLEIHPLQNKGPLMEITVSLSYLSYKRGRLMLAVSDWSGVEFRFDCQAQK